MDQDSNSGHHTMGGQGFRGEELARGSVSGVNIALLFSLIVVFLRMLVLVEPALVDPSEGRFASAALQMLQSGDWITPKIHDYGNGWIPYLAKPPLHMWLVASSLWLFGVNEFAARLPSFLALIGSAAVLFWITKLLYGRSQGVVSLAIFTSTMGLWLFAPVCLTDATLMFCVTLALASLALVWSGDRRRWVGYLFFLAVALGLMVKGPVAVVFIGLPVAIATLWSRDFSWCLRLPWVGGALLVLACTLPWYLECESKNPGFLRYFLVEEHIQRFLKPHTEVRYGAVHTEPRGTILIYAFGVLLPWSLFFLGGLLSQRLRQGIIQSFVKPCQNDSFVDHGRATKGNGVEALFIAWAIAPVGFFVFARSILPTYVFPTVPAWSLCLGLVISRSDAWRSLIKGEKLLPRLGLSFIIISLALFSVMSFRFGLNRLYLVGVVTAIVVLGGAWRKLEGYEHSSLLKFMAAAMLAIGVSVLGLGEGISLTRSTRASVQHFYQLDPKSRAPVVVLYHDPRSIHFYVTKIMSSRARVFSGNSFEALQNWRAARVMIKTSDQKRLDGLDLTGLDHDRCIGSWCLYRWKRPKQHNHSSEG